MSYNTQQDILDFVEDNNVKFVRFAFCDIFGTQKNIAEGKADEFDVVVRFAFGDVFLGACQRPAQGHGGWCLL